MKQQYMMDMTTGKPMKLMLSFTIPMLIGNIFQQLYNMVDSMIVGQFVSADALAAVGSTGSILFLLFSLGLGLSTGIGIITSQYYGAGSLLQVQKTITSSVYVLSTASLLMSLVGCIFANSILKAMNTPDGILDDAMMYLRVSCAGTLFMIAYNGISSILRALGDSKTPLMFLVLASFLNIGLDLLFVRIFHWRVFGVAFASILSQLIAALSSILFAICKHPYFKIPKGLWKPDRELMIKCLKIGTPVALQNSLISISCLALQRVVNEFKETVMSSYTAAGRFEQLVQQPFNSLGTAVATFTGQNIGANQMERVRKGFRCATLLCVLFSAAMLPVAFFGGTFIMRLFVDEPEVISIGARAIQITSLFYFPLGMIYVSRNVLNGAGDTLYAMGNGIFEVIGRVGFARPLTSIPFLGIWGIWITTGLTWTLTGSISCLRYASGKWKNKSVAHPTLVHQMDQKRNRP